MSIINRTMIVIIIIMLLLLVWLGDHLAQLQRIQSLSEAVSRAEAALSDCGNREREANTMIVKQNAAIESTRIDTVYVERLIRAAESKYAEVRKEVLLSVERDSGCENKMGNIDFTLRRFHGVGVRPENGNED